MIVRVELPELEPTDTEEGETLQVANGAGPVTMQLKFTCAEKPFCPVNINASVIRAPGCVVKVTDAGDRVKSNGGLNVAVTDWTELMVTLQTLGSIPVQPSLHPPKTDIPVGAAVSETDVPGKYREEQLAPELAQLIAPSLLAIEPLPPPARLTLSFTPKTKLAVTDLSAFMVNRRRSARKSKRQTQGSDPFGDALRSIALAVLVS